MFLIGCGLSLGELNPAKVSTALSFNLASFDFLGGHFVSILEKYNQRIRMRNQIECSLLDIDLVISSIFGERISYKSDVHIEIPAVRPHKYNNGGSHHN